MISTKVLENYLADLLTINAIADYCPNGLQVEGRQQIKKIISGVTACQHLLDVAVAEKADAILVHHGYFWKNEEQRIIGIKQKRLQTLLANNINLFAYHLPLDVHKIYGNNVQLAHILNLEIEGYQSANDLANLICYGRLSNAMNADMFADYLTEKLLHKPLYIAKAPHQLINRIAWCTGAAQSFIQTLAPLNVDAYLTGEISESTVHLARELNLSFFAAGHHATERYGVAALGEHLANKFDLEHQFIEIENPV